jgi:microcystin degradation protein MlrC
VDFHGRIDQIANGQFVNDGPMEQGLACNLGYSVVLSSVEQPHLSVVICSQCNSPNDMAWCRMHNIDLTKTRLFCVKAKNHFRAAFRPHLLHIIDIDAPGPAMLNLSALPYRHINRNYLATQ